jgi:phage baseplate assembly protein W
MIDLKVLIIKDLLQVTAVKNAANVVPRSLIITGFKFDQASQVFVNGLECPEFVIVSSSRLIAQVPDTEVASAIRSISVLANKPSVDRRSLLHFEVGKSIKGMNGLEKLVQIFCRILLQTPGSDTFHPSEGGGLLKIVGRSVSRKDSKSLQAAVVSAVGRTRDQILARQAPKSRLPSDERLLSAVLEAVGFDPATTTLTARVALTAVSGKQAVTNLLLA